MPEPVKPPARNPCGSCPYRRDVPSGVWDPEEYDKLPRYDGPTHDQPPGMFMCHQQNGRLCSGWVGCHDMEESMAIRMGIISGQLDPDDLDEIIDYQTSVPLFGSGAEAAAHGMDEVYTPSPEAGKIIDKLTQRRARQ
jgi:hypothetical protein